MKKDKWQLRQGNELKRRAQKDKLRVLVLSVGEEEEARPEQVGLESAMNDPQAGLMGSTPA